MTIGVFAYRADREREYANHLGVGHVAAVNSGTDALILALDAVRLRHGPGEVITTPFTFFATAEAVLQAGHGLVFADIEADIYIMADGDGTYSGMYMDSWGTMGPFTAHIDEAGNMPLDWLPEVSSTCAGIGIQLVTIWQFSAAWLAVFEATLARDTPVPSAASGARGWNLPIRSFTP